MSELVEQAMAQVSAEAGAGTSTQETSPNETQVSVQPQAQAQSTSQQIQPAKDIFDLDKAETVKWNGQTYKREDLQKAFMRQDDYTKKQQALAKERDDFKKSSDEFTQQEKYYRNFIADAEAVRADPSMAAEFIKIYPPKFHKELQDYLNKTPQAQAQARQEGSRPDVELLSKVQKMEKILDDQERQKNVAQHDAEIKSYGEKFSKKYPDAIEEMVIGRVYESFNKTKEVPSEETWEQAYKAVDEYMKDLVKSKYGDLVKKQTNANKTARDVSSGGGTPGKAPQKFDSFKDAIKFAADDVRSRQ